jgi:hypothetical protein
VDIDIDRYNLGGTVRQVMLGTRELSIDKLPESSRNWINEKLIYTHGYGVTMNPVNGFTADGLPILLMDNMPVQSVPPAPTLNRPELRASSPWRRLRRNPAAGINCPRGETNSVTGREPASSGASSAAP